MSQAVTALAGDGDLSAMPIQKRMELQFEVEQFLYAEAAMIDARQGALRV